MYVAYCLLYIVCFLWLFNKVDEAPTKKGKFGARQKMKAKLRLAEQTTMCIIKYYFALRYYFSSCMNIGLAVDGSRVGNLSRVLGFMTRPDGIGAWMP